MDVALRAKILMGGWMCRGVTHLHMHTPIHRHMQTSFGMGCAPLNKASPSSGPVPLGPRLLPGVCFPFSRECTS